jgi:hypothetical protein
LPDELFAGTKAERPDIGKIGGFGVDPPRPISYTAYDQATGAVIEPIQDVGTSSIPAARSKLRHSPVFQPHGNADRRRNKTPSV